MTPAAALAAARQADPAEHRWGLYLAPADGEAEGLLWFSSPTAMAAFVSRQLWPALSGVEPAADVSQALAEALSGEPPFTWDSLERVNLELDPLCQIHWWGTLRQLYEGEDPFAKDLREAWRQSSGRGPQDFSALAQSEARSFCDFLRSVFKP